MIYIPTVLLIFEVIVMICRRWQLASIVSQMNTFVASLLVLHRNELDEYILVYCIYMVRKLMAGPFQSEFSTMVRVSARKIW